MLQAFDLLGAPGEIRTPDPLVRSPIQTVAFLLKSVTCGACPHDAAVDLSNTYDSLCICVSTKIAQWVIALAGVKERLVDSGR